MTLSVEKSVLLHFAHVGPRKFPGDGGRIVGGVIREMGERERGQPGE